MNKKIQLSLGFLFITLLQGYGQTSEKKLNLVDKLRYKIIGGINIGAMSPIPLPNTIREVKSYSPLLFPTIGVESIYDCNKHWAIAARATIGWKGMSVTDSVQYFHTLIQVGQGTQTSSFEGTFTGTNYTNVRNAYITFPVYAMFTPKKEWQYKLGGYVGFLISRKFEGTVSDGYIRNGGPLGEKVTITSANFDFAERQRSFDFGLYAGVSRSVGNKWEINADLQWGIRRVFPSSFTGISFGMYNIFANMGAGYKL